MKLAIALSSNRTDKRHKLSKFEETSIYNNIANYVYYDNSNSYDLASFAKVTVVLYSNIGRELLSRNFKVIYFPIYNLLKNHSLPNFLNNNNKLLWYSGIDKNIIYEKITDILNIDTQDYNTYLNQNFENMKYDKGNNIFYNLINEILLRNENYSNCTN